MFELLALGDVARDLRGADDAAGGIENRRHGDGNGKRRAVFPLAHGLEVIDALSAPDARQHLIFFALAIRGNEQPDRLADNLVRRVLKHPLRRTIPRLDDAVQVFAQNRVVARLDDGGEVLGRTLPAGERARVARDVHCARHRAIRALYARDTESERDDLAIIPAAVDFDGIRRVELGVRQRDDDRQRASDDVLRRISEQPFGGRVPFSDDTSGISRDEGLVGNRGNRGEAGGVQVV